MKTMVETPVSFLKPEYLLRAEEDYASRKITLGDLLRIQDKAIAELVMRQIDCGLNVITDGAFHQLNGLRDFWMSFIGVVPTVILSGHIYQDQNAGEVIPKVKSDILFNPSHDVFNRFSFLHNLAGEGLTPRMDLPAPSLFYLELISNNWYDRSFYDDTRILARDIASAYNHTIKTLYEAGCRRLVLIDPSWKRLCDRLVAKMLVQGGIDLAVLPQTLLEINNEALRDLPNDMYIILYAPDNIPFRLECMDIVKCLCSHQIINAFMVDYPDDDVVFMNFLNLMPEDKDVIIGVEDSKEPQIMSHHDIRNIISKVGSVIPGKFVRYTTKGGFVNNTDSINFSSFGEHDQWFKLQNLLSYNN